MPAGSAQPTCNRFCFFRECLFLLMHRFLFFVANIDAKISFFFSSRRLWGCATSAMFRELHLLSVAYLWRVRHYSRSALGLETHRRDLCMIIHRIPIQAYGNDFLWFFNPSWHLTRLVGPRAWLLSGHSWIQWRPFHIEALCLWVSFVFLMHKFPQNPLWHLQCQTHAHTSKIAVLLHCSSGETGGTIRP